MATENRKGDLPLLTSFVVGYAPGVSEFDYDLVTIGAGSGGVAASRHAQGGVSSVGPLAVNAWSQSGA